jgi:hypothetical protein
MGEDPGPRQERTDAAAIRDAARQRLDQQRAAEQRAHPSERAADELRAQIRALALQVQSLSEATANQAAHGRAIQELRQAVREMLIASQKPSWPPAFNAEIQLPSLQIKLVLAQEANVLHQAEKDAAVLGNWATLFAGISLGSCCRFHYPWASSIPPASGFTWRWPPLRS